jgi:hypothetical protein
MPTKRQAASVGPLPAAVRSLLLRASSCAQPPPVALYALVLDLATIPIMWRKENPWTRPVHAMNHAAIVLPEDQNAAQNAVSTQALAAEAASQTGALNTYRLVTLVAVVVVAATECRMSPWDFFMFWVPMSTEVVSVAAYVPPLCRHRSPTELGLQTGGVYHPEPNLRSCVARAHCFDRPQRLVGDQQHPQDHPS